MALSTMAGTFLAWSASATVTISAATAGIQQYELSQRSNAYTVCTAQVLSYQAKPSEVPEMVKVCSDKANSAISARFAQIYMLLPTL
jgi:hypothetical protein